MSNAAAPNPQQVQADFSIEAGNFSLSFRARVPAGPVRAGELLPLARALCDTIVGETRRAVEAAGEKVSCTAGCSACCRSLVAISQVEARRIRDLIEAFPEPRRATVRARFAAARERLADAGLLAGLLAHNDWGPAHYARAVDEVFALGIDCPFLENGSCSIYEERPLTCREFLVTSPARHCAEQASTAVRPVRLPVRLFNALARWQAPAQGEFMERWVPLVLAPEWADAHPDEMAPSPGLELLRDLLAQIDA